MAKSLPQYGCNALYACLYSFSIFCASIISSLHVQCKPFEQYPLGNYLYTAPLPHLANTLPQYGCNALYACLYSFSIFCASIISSPTSLRTSSLHANSVYGGNILAVTAIPNALWRSALVAHTTAVCTVFPFPEQVLFHRPLIRGRIFHIIFYHRHLQLF